MIKLYRASSRMEIAPGQRVRIDWICPEREQPVAPYKQAIWGYQSLDEAMKLYAQASVDELLTEIEIQELRAYLARQGAGEGASQPDEPAVEWGGCGEIVQIGSPL